MNNIPEKIPKKESLTIEFKEDAPISDDDIVDVVVGFANTDGGALYIGVDDKSPFCWRGHVDAELSTLVWMIKEL